MFSNCPYCGFLVALDDTGQPLPRCPNCAQRLRDDPPEPSTPTATETVRAEQTVAAERETPSPVVDSPDDDAADVRFDPPADPEAAQARPDDAITHTTAESVRDIQPIGEAEPGDEALPAPATVGEAILEHIANADPSVSGITEIIAEASDRVRSGADADAGTALQEGPAGPQPSGSGRFESEHDHSPAPAGTATERPGHPTTPVEASPTPPIAEAVSAPATPAQPDTAAPSPEAPASPARPLPASSHGLSAVSVSANPPLRALPAPTATRSGPSPAPDEAQAPVHDRAGASRPESPAVQPVAEAEIEASTKTASPDPVEPPSAAPATIAARVRKSPATPSFARSKPQAAPVDRRKLALRVGAIAALSLLLALQLLLSDRARLAGDPRWRPLLAPLCAMLQCTLPPWREPQAFHVVERDVRARRPGVLRVSARIRNDARWPQPWPALQLTLSDANGRNVATRVFTPHEYLGGKPTQSQLGSGQSVALAMDIVEPGPQAVAFTFDFK